MFEEIGKTFSRISIFGLFWKFDHEINRSTWRTTAAY